MPYSRPSAVTPSHVSENGHFNAYVNENVTPVAQIGASYECYDVTAEEPSHVFIGLPGHAYAHSQIPVTGVYVNQV